MRIQVQIQETLIKQFSHHPLVKSAMSQLDSELMDITKVTPDNHDFQTPADVFKRFDMVVYLFVLFYYFALQLYGEFADHFKLSECKLAIIHCAGHADPILVHSLWQEIMEKGKSALCRLLL